MRAGALAAIAARPIDGVCAVTLFAGAYGAYMETLGKIRFERVRRLAHSQPQSSPSLIPRREGALSEKMNFYKTIAVTSAFAAVCSAQAQDLPSSSTTGSSQFSIGVAALVRAEAYKGVGTKSYALPIISYESERLQVIGTQASLKLFTGETIEVAAKADYRFDGFDPEDSSYFEGMAKRKGSAFAGLSAKHRSSFGVLGVEVAKAVTGSKGRRAELSFSHPINLGDLVIAPKVAAEFLDGRYVNYYYGVAGAEARAWRPAYSSGRAMNLEVGLEGVYSLGKNHSVLGFAKYRRFGSDIANSPLLEKRGTPMIAAAYMYKF